MPAAAPIEISPEDRAILTGWLRRHKTSQALARRARIVLECAEGKNNTQVARDIGTSTGIVRKWRRRFVELGPDGLLDEQRPGAPRKIMDADVERVITLTLESKPEESTHWSTRLLAKKAGMSQSAVSRIWRAFGLQPQRSETFKLSTDPLFIDKVRDVVGLYLNPPERAVVLAVDEKSQIQALDRTAPMLPLGPGQVERRTHDYQRHGTTSLFAALDVKAGTVLAECYARHRAEEFLKFLRKIDDAVPKELDVHLILDNYTTHKTAAVRNWLVKRPRFHLHFTPTSSSWLNLVERWFGLLTERQLRRGVHRSTTELEAAIMNYVSVTNRDPKPFIWTKTADQILENLARYCERISDSGH
jgi:transposase